MKSYIKEELKRAFLSKMTIITALFSILLMIIGMFDSGELPFSWVPDLSVMYIFSIGFNEGMSCYLALLFPLIVSIPFATSFISDCQCGLFKYLSFRLKRRHYYRIKFIINALVGGFVLVIGPLVGLIILLLFKVIYHIPWIQEGTTQTVKIFNDMGIYSPMVMIVIIFLNLFVCGIIFSTFSLGISIILQNKYLTVVFPFLFLLFSGTVLNSINPNLYMVNIYNLVGISSNPVMCCLVSGGYFLFGGILFFMGGKFIEEKYA